MASPDISNEKKFLDSLVVDYTDQSPYSKAKKDVVHRLARDYTNDEKNKTVLQLGCSNGYETEYLAKNFKQIDVVDGSRKFLEKMKLKMKNKTNIKYVYSLFEEYDSYGKKYDYVFCNYVLEHVLEVPYVLRNIRKTLHEDGLIIAVVPNSNAFSRQLAQKMGLIKDLYALTKNDNAHGHRRVYDKDRLIIDFNDAGYEVVATRGVIFKILADFQLNIMMLKGIIGEDHIDGLQEMAENLQEYSDSILIVAKPSKNIN